MGSLSAWRTSWVSPHLVGASVTNEAPTTGCSGRFDERGRHPKPGQPNGRKAGDGTRGSGSETGTESSVHQYQHARSADQRHKRGAPARPGPAMGLLGNIGNSLTSRGLVRRRFRRINQVDWSGAAQTWGACYEKACAICGAKGYDVLAGGSEQGAVVSGRQYGVFGGSTMNRNMLIRCKSS